MRKDIMAQALKIRADMDKAGGMLTDEQAVTVLELYSDWNPNSVPVYDGTDGEHPQTRVRGLTSGKLYKCLTSHTTQPDWPPELTPSLWVVIDVTHSGALDDPIPASRGMEYTYGLHYLDPEDGKVYLCFRGGEVGTVTLQYLPHELVGNYFEEV